MTTRPDNEPVNAETILRETIRRLELENHRLRAKLKENIATLPIAPAENADIQPSPEMPEILDVTPVRQWISRLKDEASPLLESVAGLKLGKNARIGMVILDAASYNVLKSL